MSLNRFFMRGCGINQDLSGGIPEVELSDDYEDEDENYDYLTGSKSYTIQFELPIEMKIARIRSSIRYVDYVRNLSEVQDD